MYHDIGVAQGADALEQKIATATATQRLQMQPQLGRMLDTMRRAGTPIPVRLRNLHDQLVEEAIEARFDNLPL